MRKIILVILLLTCHQYGWSELHSYTLNQFEITNDEGKQEFLPLITVYKKPTTRNLIIAGLGTNQITAQGPGLGLIKETQIFPMDKPALWATGDRMYKVEWYYACCDWGVAVIELKEKTVKLHYLGINPYTYIGMLNE